jgi:hypothetical protein
MSDLPVGSRSPEEKAEFIAKYLRFIQDKRDRIAALVDDKEMSTDIKLRIMVQIINERFQE